MQDSKMLKRFLLVVFAIFSYAYAVHKKNMSLLRCFRKLTLIQFILFIFFFCIYISSIERRTHMPPPPYPHITSYPFTHLWILCIAAINTFIIPFRLNFPTNLNCEFDIREDFCIFGDRNRPADVLMHNVSVFYSFAVLAAWRPI